MPFCGECGSPVEAGSCFCGNCGAKITAVELLGPNKKTLAVEANVFSNSDWKNIWKECFRGAPNEEIGIIVSDCKALANQLGVSEEKIAESICTYIDKAAQRGVSYCFLDISKNAISSCAIGNNVENIVALLREVSLVAKPKYIFILGDNEIVDVAAWDNQANDDDEKVFSDLVYSFLCTTSPWEGQTYVPEEALRVGRLPTTQDGFIDFSKYLEAAATGIGHLAETRSYGLSALVWKKESDYEYSRISPKDTGSSPDTTPQDVADYIRHERANLMFFNLHGSDLASAWYGQQGSQYPEAVTPNVFDGYSEPFFLGVEACYGGRYIGLNVSESILKTAMANNCLAMLASSMIAYGTATPQGSCADIIVGEFMKKIAEGETAGDAHMAGVKKLLDASLQCDDSEIKTLAEFSLYGDPSACTGNNKNIKKIFRTTTKAFHIPMPDVRRSSRLYLTEINEKIGKLIDAYVGANLLPELLENSKNINKKTYRIANSELMQNVYEVPVSIGRKVIKVYFDATGNIRKAIESK